MNNIVVESVSDAIVALTNQLNQSNIAIDRTEDLSSRKRYGNLRIYTSCSEVYHLKYSKKLFKPRDNVVGGAADLDNKLKLVIKLFGNGDESLNGIDEDLLVELVNMGAQGLNTYFTTVMADGRVLVRPGQEVYDFVLAYDTIMHFPRAFQQPVCFIPTGWLINKYDLLIEVPGVVI